MGPESRRFLDMLSRAGQTLWQVLPLNPLHSGAFFSPYSSTSAFAGNPILISPDLLKLEGFLDGDLPSVPLSRSCCEYEKVIPLKNEILAQAFRKRAQRQDAIREFVERHRSWLEDFALFMTIKNRIDERAWFEWTPELRDRSPSALALVRAQFAEEIERQYFEQYLFFSQWSALKSEAAGRGIQMMGDVPYYVGHDSADAWAHPHTFKLDDKRKPRFVGGVPPDYYSATGQLWGFPVYDWEQLKSQRYDWWVRRIRHALELFDLVRIDHFRAIVAYWEVPAGSPNAIHGHWEPAAPDDFLATLGKQVNLKGLIAEDLGTITKDVRDVMARFNIPGMKVLLFAFGGGSDHPYLPHSFEPQSLVYTGTHDNNTTLGWFRCEATQREKEHFCEYLGRTVPESEINWEMIRLALRSVSERCIIPLQDVTGLAQEARMNTPGSMGPNWRWRAESLDSIAESFEKLGALTRLYGRA